MEEEKECKLSNSQIDGFFGTDPEDMLAKGN